MSSNCCPICHEDIDFYSFGECHHPTCVKCAIKLRMFNKIESSDQTKCPTCRQFLSRIYITKNFQSLDKLNLNKFLSEPDHDFMFESTVIKTYYKKQLDCNCSKCPCKFPTMSALNRHMFSSHKLSYCDLCLKFARLLPSEFSPMTAQELVNHKKYVPELKRGHPKCQFCNKFFYEFEDLIKHIRDTHFMCDICNYGNNIEVFSTQEELIDHYENAHFICLECRRENKITFFATSEELGSHSFSVHGSDSWLPVSIVMPSSRNAPLRHENPDIQPAQYQTPVELTSENFPSLGNRNVDRTQINRDAEFSRSLASIYGSQSAPRTVEEDFPSLISPKGANKKKNTNKTSSNPSWNSSVALPTAQPSVSSVMPTNNNPVPKKQEFPSLGGPSNNKKKKNTTQSSILQSDFAELSLANRNVNNPQLNKYAKRIIEAQMASNVPKKNDSDEIAERPKQQKQGRKKKNRPSILDEDDEMGQIETLRDVNFKLSKRDQIKGIGMMNYESISSSRPNTSSIQIRESIPSHSNQGVIPSENAPESSSKSGNKKKKKSDFFDDVNQSRTGNTPAAKIATKVDFPSLSSVNPIDKLDKKNLPNQQQSQSAKKNKKKSGEAPEKRVQIDCVDPEDIIYRNIEYHYVEDFSERNLTLIQDFQSFLLKHGSSKSPFQNFTEISKKYLEGAIPSVSYMLTLLTILPKTSQGDLMSDKVSNLFAQMLALLPNIARQRALFRVLQGANIPRTGNEQVDKEFANIFKRISDTSLSKENMPSWFGLVVGTLSPCKTCKQIFLKSDYSKHVGVVHH